MFRLGRLGNKVGIASLSLVPFGKCRLQKRQVQVNKLHMSVPFVPIAFIHFDLRALFLSGSLKNDIPAVVEYIELQPLMMQH